MKMRRKFPLFLTVHGYLLFLLLTNVTKLFLFSSAIQRQNQFMIAEQIRVPNNAAKGRISKIAALLTCYHIMALFGY
jgi:hypothetical protein